MNSRLLGGLTPRGFLRKHWQKRPLFVRAALPGFAGVLDERGLAALAARDDVESRIVERRGNRWETAHGPFDKRQSALKARNATLLVSGVNHHVAGAERLLRIFGFVPHGRLDDVMVSFATPGGGVGPHVDSYDVFLIQGPGRRRWRVWPPQSKKKSDKEEHVVEAGDLLYVPPGWRHDGVALDACFTYSVGFRAPGGRELGAAFLDWLHERGLPQAGYRDPQLAPARLPARIPAAMLSFAGKYLSKIRWSRAEVERFLGEYLSAPKAHVVFRPGRGARALAQARVRLDAKTQLLYSGRQFFLNGESFSAGAAEARSLRRLADERTIPGRALSGGKLAQRVREWHRAGYVHLEKLK